MLKVKDKFNLASAVLFLVAVIIMLTTFTHYGKSVDEDIRGKGGKQAIEYYKNGFDNPELKERFVSGGNRPALFDMPAEAVAMLFPRKYRIDIRHFFGVIFGLLALVAVWMIGKELGGGKVAFFSLLFLLITPLFYGQIFISPKDIPFSTGFTWGAYFLIKLIRQFPEVKARTMLLFAISVGAAMAVRTAGVVLYFYLAVAAMIYLIYDYTLNKDIKGSAKKFLRLSYMPPIALLLSFLILIAFWPWVHYAPFERIYSALFGTLSQSHEGLAQLSGEYYSIQDLPLIRYISTYFFVRLPEIVVVSVLSSIGALVLYFKKYRHADIINVLPNFMILFTFIFPIVMAVISGSTLYHGIRHFTFLLPFIAVIAALSVSYLSDFIKNKPVKIAGLLLLTLYLIFHISVMVRLHPYQYIYYNIFAGGVKQGLEDFDEEYYATADSECTRAFIHYLKKRERNIFNKKTYHVAIVGRLWDAFEELPGNIKYERYVDTEHYKANLKNSKARFVFLRDRSLSNSMFEEYESVVEVKRFGHLLAAVKAQKTLSIEELEAQERRIAIKQAKELNSSINSSNSIPSVSGTQGFKEGETLVYDIHAELKKGVKLKGKIGKAVIRVFGRTNVNGYGCLKAGVRVFTLKNAMRYIYMLDDSVLVYLRTNDFTLIRTEKDIYEGGWTNAVGIDFEPDVGIASYSDRRYKNLLFPYVTNGFFSPESLLFFFRSASLNEGEYTFNLLSDKKSEPVRLGLENISSNITTARGKDFTIEKRVYFKDEKIKYGGKVELSIYLTDDNPRIPVSFSMEALIKGVSIKLDVILSDYIESKEEASNESGNNFFSKLSATENG